MKRIEPPVVGSTIDRRTALDRAKDELTESLRECGDAATVAVVIRFIDQMRDITDRSCSVITRPSDSPSAQSPRSWMLPRYARACAIPKRLWRNLFRFERRMPIYRYSANRITGIYAIAWMSSTPCHTDEEAVMTRRHGPPSRVIVRLAERCAGCGKVSYISRQDAKKERRRFRGSGMNAYQCPENPDVFHLGHLPPAVVYGLIGREEIRAIAS